MPQENRMCVFFWKVKVTFPRTILHLVWQWMQTLACAAACFAAADAAFAAATALRPIAPDVQMEQWSIWAVMPASNYHGNEPQMKKRACYGHVYRPASTVWPTHRRSTLHVKCWECWAEKHTEFVWGADMTSTPIDFKSRIGPYACLR